MRLFDLKLNGKALAWSLTIEQAIEVLDRLYEETYELTLKGTDVVAYRVMSGYRTIRSSAVADPARKETISYSKLAAHEHYYYE